MRSRFSLQMRLMALVLAAVLPLALLAAWFASREAESARELTLTQLRFAASLVAANQDRRVEAAQHLLGAIVNMPGLDPAHGAGCQPFFERLRDQYPTYSNIGLLDAQGQVVCHANGRLGRFNSADRPYFREAVASREFVMGQADAGRASGRMMLPFALPLLASGRVAGVAFAGLDLEVGSASLAHVQLPPGARVIVADRRARIVMEYPRAADRPLGRELQDAHVRELAQRMDPGTGTATHVDGGARIFASAVSRQVGAEGFWVLVSVPEAAVTAAAMARLRQKLALMAVVLAIGLALAWWVGRRAIVAPSRGLLAAVHRLEEGDLQARVPLHGQAGAEEFARIGSAFNAMAQALQQREGQLQQELERSRRAQLLLESVLNAMREGVVALTPGGEFLIFNRAVAQLAGAQDGPPPAPHEWTKLFDLLHPTTHQPLPMEDLPYARALRGETGELLMRVRRREPAASSRLLRCSYQPLQPPEGPPCALVVFSDVTQLESAEADLLLLRSAVARLNDVVLITEAQPLDEPGPRIVFVNEAFERLTGYTAAEAIGDTPRLLQGPQTDRATLDRIRAALQAASPVREELLNYTKSGERMWMEMDIVPLADASGRATHFIAVQRDVTARKHYEQALLERDRALEEYARMLQRAANAAQAIARHRTLPGTLQEVVDQSRHVIGCDLALLAVVEGNAWHEANTAVSVSDRHAAARGRRMTPTGAGIYALVLESGKTLRLTQQQLLDHPRWAAFSDAAGVHPPLNGLLGVPLHNVRGEGVGVLLLSDKDGAPFDDRDEYIAIELAELAAIAIENARLFGEIRDLNASLESRIVERTAELARQEQRYRALAEQLPEVVWHAGPDGSISFLNRTWYELVGGQPPEGLGFGWLKRLHPDDVESVQQNWERAQRTLEPYTGTRRFLAHDGTWHASSYRAIPVLDQQGVPEFWVGIDSDITGLKAIEQALRASNQELEAFSYSVSHDLRGPLAAIDGFSRALLERAGPGLDDKARHYLQRIRAGAVRMEQLIEALLGLSRVVRAPLRPVPVDLGAFALEALEHLRLQSPGRQVRVLVHDGLVAHGDASLLRVLVDNLVGNAWKFTAHTPQPFVEVGRELDGGPFFVRDNGAGFDMAHAGKLFSPFQRLHTEAEFPGTGIGLASVKRILTRHGGRVWAQSAPGAGTTFWFELPERPPAAPPAFAD